MHDEVEILREKHSNTVSNQQKKGRLEISERINALGVAHITV